MGNSSSSARGHHDDTVDFGSLTPQGVYTGLQDWNQAVVAQLIVQRKLAPFYRPLEEYDERWDDEQILAQRKELPENPETSNHNEATSPASSSKPDVGSSFRSHAKRPSTQKEAAKVSGAAVYRGAVECPICFLYYPANINYSRCCGQEICTECFVQIKRSEPTTTHLVSEPAACPYCVQEHFGVVYTPPSWRTGIGGDGSTPSWPDPSRGGPQPEVAVTRARRRKSFGADSPEVVTIDQIRPDWEAKLAAVRAQAQRRANRRIIMRQVGDRLIPVGVTSGRVHALTEEGGDTEGSRSGGRRRRRNQGQNPALDRLLGQVDIAGQDLEELMVMEAMRLSLIEHEQQRQRQREEEERNRRNGETSERGRSTEAGNSTSLTVPSSGQRSSSLVPPEPAGERMDHRPSSSAPNNVLDSLHTDGSWRRNLPQFSTLDNPALNAAGSMLAIPLSSSTTRTGGTDGETGTISSESSGTGHSSTRPTPDPVDIVEGSLNYTTLPSTPESLGQLHSPPILMGGDEAAASSSSRTLE